MFVETAFLHTVLKNTSETWRVKLRLCGQMLEFKINTGAQDTVFTTPKEPKLEAPKKTLYDPGKATSQCVYVVKDLKTNLLGLPAILTLDFVAKLEETLETLPHIMERYPKLIQGLG